MSDIVNAPVTLISTTVNAPVVLDSITVTAPVTEARDAYQLACAQLLQDGTAYEDLPTREEWLAGGSDGNLYYQWVPEDEVMPGVVGMKQGKLFYTATELYSLIVLPTEVMFLMNDAAQSMQLVDGLGNQIGYVPTAPMTLIVGMNTSPYSVAMYSVPFGQTFPETLNRFIVSSTPPTGIGSGIGWVNADTGRIYMSYGSVWAEL